MPKKKDAYDPDKYTFNAPVGGVYCIHYRYYDLKRGETIVLDFIKEGKSWEDALKKCNPKDFLVK